MRLDWGWLHGSVVHVAVWHDNKTRVEYKSTRCSKPKKPSPTSEPTQQRINPLTEGTNEQKRALLKNMLVIGKPNRTEPNRTNNVLSINIYYNLPSLSVFNLGRVFASLTRNILFCRKTKWSWSYTDAKKTKQKPKKQVTSNINTSKAAGSNKSKLKQMCA